MYTYHLWIVLRETTDDPDCGSLSKRIDELRASIKAKLLPVPTDPISQVNYKQVFQCSESHNHRGDTHSRLLDVLSWIAKSLPGSYGLVYWYDDESPGRHHFDGYRVIRIARGLLDDRYDPFLSPIAPVVED